VSMVGSQGVVKQFHKPGHNDETEGYVSTPNTKRLLAEHVARTKGQVFPDEKHTIQATTRDPLKK
jgi:hypothetical protein